jgi:SRSO17 transposase
MSAMARWEDEMERWFEPFLMRFETAAQRQWAPVYAKGLLLPGDRKSVQPMALGGTEFRLPPVLA